MNIVVRNWDSIIQKLKVEYGLSDVSFKTWITPLEVYDVVDSTVYIIVSLKASIDYINQKYLLSFQVCIAEVKGIEYSVKFITKEETSLIKSENNKNKESSLWKNVPNSIYAAAE